MEKLEAKVEPVKRSVWLVMDPPEEVRSYLYPGGESINLHNVTRVRVSSSGNHYVESKNGHHIIAPGWRAIHLQVAEWQF